MKYPYCVVDGVKYKLEMVNDVLRFPNTKEACGDLNQLVMDYYNGRISLSYIWNEYSQTGSSYSMVEGIFSPYGINNHTVTQGNGKCKDMVLFSGDQEVDDSYNYSDDEKIIANVQLEIATLYEDSVDDKDKLIGVLTDCINKLKTI
mgnify:CR=1 FL=1